MCGVWRPGCSSHCVTPIQADGGASVAGALSPFSPPPVTVHVIVDGTRDGKVVARACKWRSSARPGGLGCSLASPVPYSPNGVRGSPLQSPTAPSKRETAVGTQGSPLGRGSAGEAQGEPPAPVWETRGGGVQAGPPAPGSAATPGRWLRQSWARFPQLHLKGADLACRAGGGSRVLSPSQSSPSGDSGVCCVGDGFSPLCQGTGTAQARGQGP